jgi:hypothetical protein
MRVSPQLIFSLVFVLVAVTGCHQPTPHELLESGITVQYARKCVRPLSDPVAVLAHKGADLPPELLRSNQVTLVELIHKKGDRQTLFQDEKRRPPSDGMVTSVDHAHNIGLFFPATLTQPEIEVRVNYSCDIGDFVAVHVVVPNPLAVAKRP